MSSDAITQLILAIFRTNSRLIMAGDHLTAPLGLTSARWQVLGAVADAEPPKSVSALARELGVSRQGVQRIIGELVAEGTLAYEINPRHKRAQLVVLTAGGRTLYDRTLAVQRPWAQALADSLADMQIVSATTALRILAKRLDDDRRAAKV